MMDNIKRFFECYVPVTVCNLRCSYCYVIQEKHRTLKYPDFQYTPEHIGLALSKERLGGICYFSICGGGETLLPHEVPMIVKEILKQGHYVNVTTNGTITKRIEDLLEMDRDLCSRLHFSLSFHYVELKRKGWLDRFFDNVNLIKNKGCSYTIQLNWCDDYIPLSEEIKGVCMNRLGFLPQLQVTRDESEVKNIKLLTSLSKEEYISSARSYASNLFDFGMRNFRNRLSGFCYAGEWSGVLELSQGILRKCYSTGRPQNIFEDIRRPIVFEPIGYACKSSYCINSTHFLSLGVKPNVDCPTYACLRNRNNCFNRNMYDFLNAKLSDNNSEHSLILKLYFTMKTFLLDRYDRTYRYVRRKLV